MKTVELGGPQKLILKKTIIGIRMYSVVLGTTKKAEPKLPKILGKTFIKFFMKSLL